MHAYASRTTRDISGLTHEFNKNVKLLTEGNELLTTSNISLTNKIVILSKNVKSSQEEIGSIGDAVHGIKWRVLTNVLKLVVLSSKVDENRALLDNQSSIWLCTRIGSILHF